MAIPGSFIDDFVRSAISNPKVTNRSDANLAKICDYTILGMKNTAIREGLYYHTPEDTVDKIEPAAVRAVLEISAAFIVKKDTEVSF